MTGTAGTELPGQAWLGQECQDRTAGIGLPATRIRQQGQNRNKRTARKGQLEQYSENGTVRMGRKGLPGQGCQDRIARTRLPGQGC